MSQGGFEKGAGTASSLYGLSKSTCFAGTRPSPPRGRFTVMESFNLQDWTRIGAMDRAHCASVWSAPAERSGDGALVWSEERRQFESGVALRLPPHSKTLSVCRRFMEGFHSFLRMHWDDELISLGRARLRRALIFVAPKEFQGLDGVSPYLEVHGERQPARSAFKTELWNFHGFF